MLNEHWACAAAGHVEPGESACRETLEELGITIESTDLRPLCAMHRTAAPGWKGQRVDFLFECSRWSGAPRLLEAEKAAELRWFDHDALPSGCAARALRPRDAAAHHGDITAPTLVVVGEQDSADCLLACHTMAAQVLSAQIETLPGVDHNVPERAGRKFTNMLRQFLDTALRSDSDRKSTSLLP